MFTKGIHLGLGDWLGSIKCTFINRTGATLLRGQLAMVDILDTQAEVTSILEADEAGVFAQLTPVTQASAEEGFPIVVACESILDNAKGLCCLWGKIEVAVLDDDVSTTDIDKGDRVSILVSESAVAAQAFVTGGTGSRVIGIAMQDAAATSSDTDRLIDASSHLRWVIFTGGMPVLGSTDT